MAIVTRSRSYQRREARACANKVTTLSEGFREPEVAGSSLGAFAGSHGLGASGSTSGIEDSGEDAFNGVVISW